MMKYSKHILFFLFVVMMLPLRAELLPYPIDTIRGTALYRYPVEKSIGLYRISVNFGVTQEEIIRWNPQLSSRGLRFDEVILIPVKQEAAPIVQETTQTQQPAEEKTESIQPQPKAMEIPKSAPADIVGENDTEKAIATQEIERVESIDIKSFIPALDTIMLSGQDTIETDSTTIRLALLLPLSASASKRDASMDRFYDFYAGALLAIRAAERRGQHFEIYTYDIGKTDAVQRGLMRDSALCGMHAIIGPAYSSQIAAAAEWALQDSVLTVIPFSSSVPQITSNPFLMQFNPSAAKEARKFAEYLVPRGDSVNCVLIQAQEKDIPQSIRYLHGALKDSGIPCTYTTIHAILADSIYSSLKDSAENIIVFNTEKFGNLQTIIPHLLPLTSRYQLTLFSHYSWQNEKNRLPEIYTTIFEPNMQLDSTQYVEDFDYYFHHTLSSVLPRYDVLGYDLTNQVIEMLRSGGTAIHNGLQSQIHYEKESEEQGWINNNIQVIRKRKHEE